MESSKWPDLRQELEGIEVPDELPDPRDAFCAVFLLGPVRVFRSGRRVVGGWRLKSLELLAYLAVHQLGAAKDQILEALWPEGDPRQTQQNLWHTISLLRSRLGGSSASGRIVHKTDDLYRLDFENVWVDVASFEGAVKLAEREAGLEPSLRFACDLYKGGFCDGRYYGWATLAQERLRMLFIEASRKLARQLQTEGEPEGALVVLDGALLFDPYNEELVRQALAIDAQLGRQDSLVRRFRKLRRLLLSDLEIAPSELTVSTFDHLLHEAAQGHPEQDPVTGFTGKEAGRLTQM